MISCQGGSDSSLCPQVSNMMVMLLRMLMSCELQRREDFFAPFIMVSSPFLHTRGIGDSDLDFPERRLFEPYMKAVPCHSCRTANPQGTCAL